MRRSIVCKSSKYPDSGLYRAGEVGVAMGGVPIDAPTSPALYRSISHFGTNFDII